MVAEDLVFRIYSKHTIGLGPMMALEPTK